MHRELCFHFSFDNFSTFGLILLFGFFCVEFFFFFFKKLLKFKVFLFLLTAGFAHPANIDAYLLTFIKYFFIKTDPCSSKLKQKKYCVFL